MACTRAAMCALPILLRTVLTAVSPVNQSGKRRVVVALRQRGGRTLPFVATSEAHGVLIASKVVEKNSKMFADEASHWDALHATFDTARINHSVAYSLDGIHTNLVESYFSRLRRMIEGQHHHVSVRHLHQYAGEAAWKEDHRELQMALLAHRALGLALSHSRSRYFQAIGIAETSGAQTQKEVAAVFLALAAHSRTSMFVVLAYVEPQQVLPSEYSPPHLDASKRQ